MVPECQFKNTSVVKAHLKYLAAFILPLVTVISFNIKGWMVWLPFIYAFVIVPFLDTFLPLDKNNLSKNEEDAIKNAAWFKFMLALIVPAHFYVLWVFLTIDFASISLFETVGVVFGAGLSCGVLGINVGHELGHKNDNLSKFLAHILLMSSLYMHFYIEHNYGHHRNVATKEDPATARRNEPLYSFWVRSIFYSYVSAWKIQFKLHQQHSFFSFKNNMLIYHVVQLTFLMLIFFVFGSEQLLYFLLVAVIGILLLETVNYIEHYGLMRKQDNGTYERTTYAHSWNSNHVMGRLVLFDLSRHSDHHYKSTRPYQILRYHEKSPQLPNGYPAMMLLSLIPPVWFKVIHPHIDRFKATINNE